MALRLISMTASKSLRHKLIDMLERTDVW